MVATSRDQHDTHNTDSSPPFSSARPPLVSAPDVSQKRSSFYGTFKVKAASVLQRSKLAKQSVTTLVETIAAPPPPAGGDGLTTKESAAPSDIKATNTVGGSLWVQVKTGNLASDAATLLQAASSATGPIDDRDNLLEHLVAMLQKMPTDSALQQPLTDKFIELLWNDLQHPPVSYTGLTYRAADGSGQSATSTQLGAANTPYARSVSPCHPKNPHLPSPGVVFDALLRREKFKPHPSGISSLLFSFATIIVHSTFQTSRTDASINEASSYLDLSPLYGNNVKEQATVRSFKQGRLFPDVIASSRMFFMPPSVVALLVIFNRNHNYIAHTLYKINEKGTYKAWESLDEAGRKEQDSEIFERARLINCGWFLNTVVQDYIRTILNINTTTSTWSLAPNVSSRAFPTGFTPRGLGNGVSAEFNILYRWHAAISKKDEVWIEGLFRETIGNVSIEELTEPDFVAVLRKLSQQQGPDPRKWTIPGISRTSSGSFADEDLCRIITEATDEIAGAFGANGSPNVMRIMDCLGIATARNEWNVCTMNEFRTFLNLKPFATFEEWNSDPVVADRARRLYGHPNDLELFVGLHAEEAKMSGTGSGLAANYTVTRAILSDAVALVRGDRFFTLDYNSATLSSWGYQDVTPDTSGGAYGGCIGRLLMRCLPRSYANNSTYALFPFSTPETMREILTKNGVIEQYDISKPKQTPPTHGVFTYKACLAVLADTKRFGTIYDEPIKNCSNEYGYFIAQEGAAHKMNRQVQAGALFITGWQDGLRMFYAEKTAELIEQNSWSYDGGKTKILDVVRDVTNLTAVHWVTHQFGIPLKTSVNPRGLFTPQELYLILSAFFLSVFMNFDLSSSFKLRTAAKAAAPALLGVIRLRLAQVKGLPAVLDDLARRVQDRVLDKSAQGIVMGKEARAYYERLLTNNQSLEQLASSVQSTMTASVSNQGQATAQVINFFLEDANKEHKAELVELCKLDTPEADKKIQSLVWEAMRLDPQVPLIPRVALEDATIQDGDRTVHIKKGDFVYPSMLKAGQDPTVFPEPEKVKERDPSIYRLFGHGAHTCLGAPICEISITQMVKQVFRLPNVRRAPGNAGQLIRYDEEIAGTPCHVYLSANATPWPLPVSLSVVYDAE
ncbi:hypothetical protein JCM11641_002083 [Rhodosporidiobolus odoratus]